MDLKTAIKMKCNKVNLLRLGVMIFMLVLTVLAQAQTICYVKKGVNNGNGTSWAKAFGELSDALDWAKQNQNSFTVSNPLEIWVAKGTYVPDTKASSKDSENKNTTDRDKAFVMVKNVQLYGGFTGAETQRTQKNSVTNSTVLDGRLNGQNKVYHVLIAAGNLGVALIDGFEINNGYNSSKITTSISVNNLSIDRASGGGLYIAESDITVSNCKFSSNRSYSRGGAIYVIGKSSDYVKPTIEHCTFFDNTSTLGGGLFERYSAATIFNCVFNLNNADEKGGGMYSTSSKSLLGNSVFYLNTADDGGAIAATSINNNVFSNLTIYGNTAKDNGGGLYVDEKLTSNSRLTLSNSIILGNQLNRGSSTYGISNSDNIINFNNNLIQTGNQNSGGSSNGSGNAIANTRVSDIFVSTSYDNANFLRLKPDSYPINKGKNTAYTLSSFGDRDLAENSRFRDVTIDMGAYETQSGNYPLPVNFENISATIYEGRLQIQWNTLNESNNSHFEIQASQDGENWTTIDKVQSKAENGSSTENLHYEYQLPISAVMGITFFAFALLGFVKKPKYFLLAFLGIVLFAVSCSKNDAVRIDKDSKLFVRIAQVDKDGSRKFSKVIQATKP